MTLTNDHIQRLIQEYPYLQPRNVWTDKIPEDYDFSYMRGVGELPPGWERLFLMCCKDLKTLLDKDQYTDDFRFSEIKEKYNSMRLYHNGATEGIIHVLYMYEHLSSYICQCCGKIATFETSGWIASYCDNCMHKTHSSRKNRIKRKFKMHIEQWKLGKTTIIKYDARRTWKLYKQLSKLTDEEFIENYMLSC